MKSPEKSLVKGVLPMKAKRHAKLLELIHNNDIYTQEDLMRHLQSAGFDVTQATVSRDIKELRLVKMLSGNGKYKYSTGKEPTRPTPPKFDSLFADAIESIEPAMNMIAVKCMTGMAQAICVALEAMYLSGIVGTLAGDDTIFILCKDIVAANETTVQLKNIMRG